MCGVKMDKQYNYRVIKSSNSYDPDEPVIAVTLELSAAELIELRLALTNHIRHMTNRNYYYHDMRNIDKSLSFAMDALKERRNHISPSSF